MSGGARHLSPSDRRPSHAQEVSLAIPSERLDRICRIPEALSRRSLRDLVDEVGYRELRPMLDRQDLTAYLAGHPRLVLDWLRYSQGKRTSGGWYLMHPSSSGWVVGRLAGAEAEREIRFGSGPEACAEFILRELDSVADSMVGASRSD